jgi:hypothetical protein
MKICIVIFLQRVSVELFEDQQMPRGPSWATLQLF